MKVHELDYGLDLYWGRPWMSIAGPHMQGQAYGRVGLYISLDDQSSLVDAIAQTRGVEAF